MQNKRMALRGLATGLLLMALWALASQAADDTPNRPSIVFDGTVIKVGAPADAPASVKDAKCLVVRPERFTQVPDSLRKVLGTGKDALVTVKVADPSRFRVGDRAHFSTRVWMMGKG